MSVCFACLFFGGFNVLSIGTSFLKKMRKPKEPIKDAFVYLR